MTREVPQGYRYPNPGAEDPTLTTIEVIPALATSYGFGDLAKDCLQIQLEAMQDAFKNDDNVSSERIAQAVNPLDREQVSEAADRLRTAVKKGWPYYHAHAAVQEGASGPARSLIAGIGRAVAFSGLDRPTRKLLEGLNEDVAKSVVGGHDITSAVGITVDVRPAFQGQRLGSAILDTLVRPLPEDTLVVAQAFPVNRALPPLLRKFGFVPVGSRPTELLDGVRFNRDVYLGPTAGTLTRQLDAANPLFRQRTLIEAY
jgi:ribosomal protein S18 acetylase RimI-like enzyme